MTIPLPPIQQPVPPETSQITPTLYTSTAQPDPLEVHSSATPFNLAHIVQVKNPPPILRDPEPSHHATDINQLGYDLHAFGTDQYSPTGTFGTGTTSPYTAGHNYGQSPSLYDAFAFPYQHAADPTFHFANMNYQGMQEPQLPNNQGQDSDHRHSLHNDHAYYQQ